MSTVSSPADIIFDWYFNNSTTNLNRNGRGYSLKLLFNDGIPLPSKFNDSVLKNNDNKERLNLYCADKFQSYQEDNSIIQCNKVIRESFSVTKGESVLSYSTLDEPISISTAEEADKKLVPHMIQCVRRGANNVL